ncbi:EamA family transporter [Candidatus Peregrinibacteria bacterium]|nr:EamA family transporter [Candidatus Peregrinibacteria bacterium]
MGNIFILISVALNVLGQTALKGGVNKLGALSLTLNSIFKAFTTPLVLSGLFLYAVSSIFWILALSHKDLSYAYPMLSLGYIAVVLMSWAILGEQVTIIRFLGVILISFGIFLVFKSA